MASVYADRHLTERQFVWDVSVTNIFIVTHIEIYIIPKAKFNDSNRPLEIQLILTRS